MTKQVMDFKGVFIPAAMWCHTELSWTARISLVQIYYLSKEGVGCFASNAFLAGFLGLSEGYVRNLISKLTAEGYLVQVKNGRRRELFVTAKTGLIVSQKCDDLSQKCDTLSQKCDAINIYKNNINTEREESALTVYREIYPDYQLDLFSSDRLAAFDCDLSVWRATVVDWRTNSYRPNNLVGMMDAYTQRKAKLDEAAKPEHTPMTYCDACRDTSGLIKTEGVWTRCNH